MPSHSYDSEPTVTWRSSRSTVTWNGPHPRMHLDLYADDQADQAAQVERLIALGATKVDWDLFPANPDFVLLAGREGNRFCVIDTGQG